MEYPEEAYLTGPMTGYAHHNHPEFHRVAKKLRAAGIDIDNPAEHFEGAVDGRPMEDFLGADIGAICKQKAVIVMGGWSESGGSNVEVLFAWYCKLPVWNYADDDDDEHGFTLTPATVTPPAGLPYQIDTQDDLGGQSILAVADGLINGARRSTYGHPADDYGRVSGAVNSFFSHLFKDGCGFRAEDIPVIVILIKISREVHCAKRGNRVDGAGYWGVIDMIHEERSRRSQQSEEATTEFLDEVIGTVSRLCTSGAQDGEKPK